MTLGTMIREAREAAGLSLAKVGAVMDLSAPYLHDVEHDRRPLASFRWHSLIAALPAISLRDLAEKSLETGVVRIDARMLTKAQRSALADAILLNLGATKKKGRAK